MHYIVKKPFSFNGQYYKAGDVFSQQATKATDAKVRSLVSARYVALGDGTEKQHVAPEPHQPTQEEVVAETVTEEAVSEPQADVEKTTETVVEGEVAEVTTQEPHAPARRSRRRP